MKATIICFSTIVVFAIGLFVGVNNQSPITNVEDITHGPRPEPEIHEVVGNGVKLVVQVLNDGTRCAIATRASYGPSITCDWSRNEWVQEERAAPGFYMEEDLTMADKRPL